LVKSIGGSASILKSVLAGVDATQPLRIIERGNKVILEVGLSTPQAQPEEKECPKAKKVVRSDRELAEFERKQKAERWLRRMEQAEVNVPNMGMPRPPSLR
jgi:hypothetical protein